MKGTVKIAYWDTEQQGGRPPLLGEIKGTPTIRLYKPKKKQEGGSNKKKVVVDYNSERKAKEMKNFVDNQMPSAVEKINGSKDLLAFEGKAERNGLPQVFLFTAKPNTSPLTKYLSTEFRRRLLIAEIKTTKPNKDIIDKFGIMDFPAIVVILPSKIDDGEYSAEDIIRYDGDGFTRNKLHRFLSKHALKDKVMPKKKHEEAENAKKKNEGVKTEL